MLNVRDVEHGADGKCRRVRSLRPWLPRKYGWPVLASQSFSVLSQLPERARVPSGENATDLTSLECPLKVRRSRPVATSQSFSVLSQLPERTRVPSGENATDSTHPVCAIFGTISILRRSWALVGCTPAQIATRSRPRTRLGRRRPSSMSVPQRHCRRHM